MKHSNVLDVSFMVVISVVMVVISVASVIAAVNNVFFQPPAPTPVTASTTPTIVTPQTVMITTTGTINVNATSIGQGNFSLQAIPPAWEIVTNSRYQWSLVMMDDSWWRLDLRDLHDAKAVVASWRSDTLIPNVPTIFKCENQAVNNLVVTRN